MNKNRFAPILGNATGIVPPGFKWLDYAEYEMI